MAGGLSVTTIVAFMKGDYNCGQRLFYFIFMHRGDV